jgi:hypothetical protein
LIGIHAMDSLESLLEKFPSLDSMGYPSYFGNWPKLETNFKDMESIIDFKTLKIDNCF